jgi:hypothetical protein
MASAAAAVFVAPGRDHFGEAGVLTIGIGITA